MKCDMKCGVSTRVTMETLNTQGHHGHIDSNIKLLGKQWCVCVCVCVCVMFTFCVSVCVMFTFCVCVLWYTSQLSLIPHSTPHISHTPW